MLSHMDRFEEDLPCYQTLYITRTTRSTKGSLIYIDLISAPAGSLLPDHSGREGPPGVLPPLAELEQTVHEAQQEAGAGVVGGEDDVPVLLQEVQDAEEAQALGEGLLGLGQAVQDDFIQTAVQSADGAVPL